MKQAFCRRHRHQRGDLCTSARLPENHYVIWIAPEFGDVFPYPLQREDNIKLSGVARIGKFRPAEPRQVRITKCIQAMIDRYEDNLTPS